MFSSRLNVFLPTQPCPPIGRPACPEPGRARSNGSALSRPFPAGANPRFAHSLPSFSTATLVGPHRKTRNSNPLIRLLHDSVHTAGRGLQHAACPSLNSRPNPISATFKGLSPSLKQSTSNLGQPPIARISFRIRTYAKCARNPFRIRTSKTKDLKPFRMNTYRKRGRGGIVPLVSSSVALSRRPSPPLVVC
jgi:hypothetical protein